MKALFHFQANDNNKRFNNLLNKKHLNINLAVSVLNVKTFWKILANTKEKYNRHVLRTCRQLISSVVPLSYL